MPNRKVTIILLTVGLMKWKWLYENELFFRNAQHKNNIKVALDLPNYPTKSDLKKRNKNWYITVS